MFAVADTTFDLFVLELVLHRLGVGVGAFVLGVLAPADARSEDDVLADRRGIGSRAGTVFGAEAELAPGFAVGHSRVHRLLVGDISNASGRLYFLPLVVVAEGDDGLGPILVGNGLGRGEIAALLLDVIIVGPVMSGEWGGRSVGLALQNRPDCACHLKTDLGFGGAVVAMIAVLDGSSGYLCLLAS